MENIRVFEDKEMTKLVHIEKCFGVPEMLAKVDTMRRKYRGCWVCMYIGEKPYCSPYLPW